MGDTDRGELALRVERGTATAEELAALTVVLLALRRRPAWQPGGNTKPVGLFDEESEVACGRFLSEGGGRFLLFPGVHAGP
ncbi:acyl-CoA carboxylase subunit epsilon [Streptomyces sp. NPDC049541]|uniref:acyl-CoA carboxylase subunit epsilon n=1 Tax=Streptomyces sp. NPDC049541 TaxID=3365594 RepID=UPI0037A7CCC1